MASFYVISKMASAAILFLNQSFRINNFYAAHSEISPEFECHQNRSIFAWNIAFLRFSKWRPPPSCLLISTSGLIQFVYTMLWGIIPQVFVKICQSVEELWLFVVNIVYNGKSLFPPLKLRFLRAHDPLRRICFTWPLIVTSLSQTTHFELLFVKIGQCICRKP